MSIFDSADFNDRLFVLRRDASPTPPGAHDRMIAADGATLHVRVHAPAGGVMLLLFHGNGEVVADYDVAAALFARAGVTLAVMDYRGYGESSGVSTLRNLIADARVVAEAVRPQIVMGRSLGGMAAHELYARPVAGMAGVILESTLFDIAALVRRRGLEPPAAFSDEERAAFDPALKLAAGRLPLLVLHGERDDLIVPREAMSALATAGTPAGQKAMVMVARRGHNDVSLEDSYWSALAGFVAQLPAAKH